MRNPEKFLFLSNQNFLKRAMTAFVHKTLALPFKKYRNTQKLTAILLKDGKHLKIAKEMNSKAQHLVANSMKK